MMPQAWGSSPASTTATATASAAATVRARAPPSSSSSGLHPAPSTSASTAATTTTTTTTTSANPLGNPPLTLYEPVPLPAPLIKQESGKERSTYQQPQAQPHSDTPHGHRHPPRTASPSPPPPPRTTNGVSDYRHTLHHQQHHQNHVSGPPPTSSRPESPSSSQHSQPNSNAHPHPEEETGEFGGANHRHVPPSTDATKPASQARLVPIVLPPNVDPSLHPLRSDAHHVGHLLALWVTGHTQPSHTQTRLPASADPNTRAQQPPPPPSSLFDNPDLRTYLWRLRSVDSRDMSPKTVVLDENHRRRIIETTHPSRVRVDTIISATQFLIHAELPPNLTRDDICIRVDDMTHAVFISGGTPSENDEWSGSGRTGSSSSSSAAGAGGPSEGRVRKPKVYPFCREIRVPSDVVLDSMLAWVDRDHPVLVIDAYRNQGQANHANGGRMVR